MVAARSLRGLQGLGSASAGSFSSLFSVRQLYPPTGCVVGLDRFSGSHQIVPMPLREQSLSWSVVGRETFSCCHPTGAQAVFSFQPISKISCWINLAVKVEFGN